MKNWLQVKNGYAPAGWQSGASSTVEDEKEKKNTIGGDPKINNFKLRCVLISLLSYMAKYQPDHHNLYNEMENTTCPFWIPPLSGENHEGG